MVIQKKCLNLPDCMWRQNFRSTGRGRVGDRFGNAPWTVRIIGARVPANGGATGEALTGSPFELDLLRGPVFRGHLGRRFAGIPETGAHAEKVLPHSRFLRSPRGVKEGVVLQGTLPQVLGGFLVRQREDECMDGFLAGVVRFVHHHREEFPIIFQPNRFVPVKKYKTLKFIIENKKHKILKFRIEIFNLEKFECQNIE